MSRPQRARSRHVDRARFRPIGDACRSRATSTRGMGGEKVARSVTRCSHGRAAKLVNMYLKLRVACGPAGEDADARPKVGAIHPPIDRQILKALARDCRPYEVELRRKLGLSHRGLGSVRRRRLPGGDQRGARMAENSRRSPAPFARRARPERLLGARLPVGRGRLRKRCGIAWRSDLSDCAG